MIAAAAQHQLQSTISRHAADADRLIHACRATAGRTTLPPRTPAQQAFLDQAYRAQQAQRFAPSEA